MSIELVTGRRVSRSCDDIDARPGKPLQELDLFGTCPLRLASLHNQIAIPVVGIDADCDRPPPEFFGIATFGDVSYLQRSRQSYYLGVCKLCRRRIHVGSKLCQLRRD
ncbi:MULTISPECIES: hypothetical protein [Nocardiaceae]|uniref:hypothetical protein n=1 Tax=Nocardiaceae TaxID=85025 RepID=UPI0012D2F26A|nr:MULTISPECIES: hypothetical protein [Rhodococcus]